MKLKGLSMYLFILVIIYACSSSKKKYDGYSICQEFYELNKNKDLTFFKNIGILVTREYSIYDDSTRRYDRIPLSIVIYLTKDSVINLPSYSYNADIEEKKFFFNRCDTITLKYIGNKYKTAASIDSLFKYYQAEIDMIYKEYLKVEVPTILPYNNILISGRYNNGYIEFELLDEKEDQFTRLLRCYLLVDSFSLNRKTSELFSKLSRFDDKWYYDIGKTNE